MRLPEGSRSIISRDLNVSLNEFLFEPALPFLTVDTTERFPDNKALATAVYGLKRRLEADGETLEAKFSEVSTTPQFGELTDMMADGIGEYAEMKGRLATALAERAEIDRRLEDAEVAPAIALHPDLAEAYRRNVEKLTEALNAPELEAGEARLALRNLIELITAEPRAEGRGLDLLVHGRLAQILHIANDRPELSQGGRMPNVVAGARSDADHKSGSPDRDCMFEMVAGARNSAKQQKTPEGAGCMLLLVAGTRNQPKHTFAVTKA